MRSHVSALFPEFPCDLEVVRDHLQYAHLPLHSRNMNLEIHHCIRVYRHEAQVSLLRNIVYMLASIEGLYDQPIDFSLPPVPWKGLRLHMNFNYRDYALEMADFAKVLHADCHRGIDEMLRATRILLNKPDYVSFGDWFGHNYRPLPHEYSRYLNFK